MVDAHALLSEKSGKINTVKEADDTADESGQGQDNSTCDKGIFSFHEAMYTVE